jgi:hypothetical protein
MMARVNRDASLFRVGPGTGVPARHARDAQGDWFGNAHRRPVGFAAGRAGRNCRRNRSGRGRSNCKSATEHGIPRKCTGVPMMRRHGRNG